MDLTDDTRMRQDPRHKIILSVDLGKQQDFTALTISEAKPEVRKNTRGKSYTAMVVNVRDIQRLPLGTDYDDIAKHIHEVFWDDRLWLFWEGKWRSPTLLVDAGGVGDAVADTLAKTMGLRHIRYRLVRGTAATNRRSARDYTIPRTVMFQQLYAAFTTNRIKVDPRLKLAKALISELKGLQVERNEETGYERVTHREGEHDDMAICVASTNWWVNLPKPRPARFLGPDHPAVAKLLGFPQEKRHISTEENPQRAAPLPMRMPTGRRWSAS
jgi:hypothetical protein